MFVTSYSVTSGKTRIFFHYNCAVYDECKYSDTFCFEDRIRLFVHYTISLSSLCKLIWRHWTYKMPVSYILSIVWVSRGIFSQLWNNTILVFSAYPFPCNDWDNIYTGLIIIIKSEVWNITHCLGSGHETMVCAVCLFVFLWINPAWISNHMPSRAWDEISYPFPNFNGCTFEVRDGPSTYE